MHNKIYITIVVVVYAVVATVFLVFPRSTYSELEKRELAQMPEFSTSKLRDNSYPKELAAWFSDSEPYRDQLMATSMWVRDKLRLSLGDDEAISFHASDSGSDEPAPPPADADAAEIAAYQNRINADANAKIANKGIIVVGKAPVARALMAYGGKKGGEKTAEALNRYHSELGVNVYAMVIPLATEFYLPDKARGASSPQLPTIQNIYAHLAPGVKGVNAYSALASHVGEDIYLRTDHHWAPLGAYYAAEQLAKSAGVPFKPLSSYERKVVHGFVGSMYGYSKDIAIKNSPEDFVYHTPKGLNYVTTYINYKVNGDYRVTSESRPRPVLLPLQGRQLGRLLHLHGLRHEDNPGKDRIAHGPQADDNKGFIRQRSARIHVLLLRRGARRRLPLLQQEHAQVRPRPRHHRHLPCGEHLQRLLATHGPETAPVPGPGRRHPGGPNPGQADPRAGFQAFGSGA